MITNLHLYFIILLITIILFILFYLFARKYLKIGDAFTKLLCSTDPDETEIKMMSKELDKYRNITFAILILANLFVFLLELVKV